MTAFDSPDLGRDIASVASRCGVELGPEAVERLVEHVRRVMRANERLHLTTILDPDEFLERHLGESLVGASMLPRELAGTLLDLGSGNGYPGVVVANARPGLRPILTEASRRKAAFLREIVAACSPGGEVFEGQVQRAPDLRGLTADVLTTRAMGAWEKIVPRMHAALNPGAHVLVWAGGDVEKVFRREVWRRFEVAETRALDDREASAIWRLRPLPR